MLCYCRRLQATESRLIDQFRQSSLYNSVYKRMLTLRGQAIDEILIEPIGILVTSCCPSHILLSYDFKQNGNQKRNDAVSRLVAQLLAEDFSAALNKGAYKLSRYRIWRSNGRMEYAFRFTMRSTVKDRLMFERTAFSLRLTR